MVKFGVEKRTVIGRLGRIERWGSIEMEHQTPSFMTYLRGGHIPHLTWEVAQNQLNMNQTHIFQLTVPSLINSMEIIKKFKKGVRKFCGMPNNSAIHLSVQDPLGKMTSGYNDSKSVAVWTKNGKVSVTVSLWRDLINSFGCESFETLVDYDIPKDAGVKRQSKSTERTRVFNEQMFLQDEKIEGSAIISLGGGFSSFYRRKCAVDNGLGENVSGYNIEFHDFANGNEFNEKEVLALLTETFSPLPPTKIRIMCGPFDPKRVLSLVEAGIDMFDSSYAVKLAEEGKVFGLADDYPKSAGFETIDFNNEKYSDDFTKIFENCQCYTCQKYTKGYLQHLVNTKELLASILLVIHNISEYDRMFKLIRTFLSDSEAL